MRDTFVRALTEIARRDRNVMLLTADLGFGVLTKFARDFPGQYLNVGVAEQNMTGIATGLALEGKVVFTYSIANFPTLRCLEQIRNDACYHRANVKIVGIGGGLSYGSLGMSHHATEDIGIMRSLPNMTVLAPGDTYETEQATYAAYRTGGAFYLRLGRGDEALIHTSTPSFIIGKAISFASEGDVALISTGGILNEVMQARAILTGIGIRASVHSMHTVKPVDEQLLLKLSKSSRLIVTIEEHNVIAGLGAAVAETISEFATRPPLLRLGLPDCFSSEVGDQKYLREFYNLSPKAIADSVMKCCKKHGLFH